MNSRNRKPARQPYPKRVEGSGVCGEVLPSDLLLSALNQELARDLKAMKEAFARLNRLMEGNS